MVALAVAAIVITKKMTPSEKQKSTSEWAAFQVYIYLSNTTMHIRPFFLIIIIIVFAAMQVTVTAMKSPTWFHILYARLYQHKCGHTNYAPKSSQRKFK